MKIYHVFILCLIVLLFPTLAPAEQSSFKWITKNQNFKLYEHVRKVFEFELQPDDPVKVAPVVPYKYKYIAHIGVYKSSCLVIIGHRESKDSKWGDFFTAYNYNLKTDKKDRIDNDITLWLWTFMSFAIFEPNPIPDIIFKYYNCTECEAVLLLSSFQYDKETGNWNFRKWPQEDSHLVIGSADQYGDDIWSYDYLLKIADFNNDGFIDIAIRGRMIGQASKAVEDKTFLYTIQKGIPQKIELSESLKKQKVNEVLCADISSPLCK